VSLYGLRALPRHVITRALFDVPAEFWRYMDSVISNVIVTPIILFIEDVYGKGWKSGLRWILWAQAARGLAAIAADVIRHNPGATADPSNLLLFTFPALLAIGQLRGYRPPRSSWAAIIFAGGVAFLLTVIVDHLRDAGLTPWQMRIEPYGFIANLICLGYVAVQRFVTDEQQLIAIDEEMKSAARIITSIDCANPAQANRKKVVAALMKICAPSFPTLTLPPAGASVSPAREIVVSSGDYQKAHHGQNQTKKKRLLSLRVAMGDAWLSFRPTRKAAEPTPCIAVKAAHSAGRPSIVMISRMALSTLICQQQSCRGQPSLHQKARHCVWQLYLGSSAVLVQPYGGIGISGNRSSFQTGRAAPAGKR
jgi:hypothetical protein